MRVRRINGCTVKSRSLRHSPRLEDTKKRLLDGKLFGHT
jgi:hypothetical protein